MARKTVPTSNNRKNIKKKNKKNPKYHPKRVSTTKFVDSEPDYEFAYDSPDFLRKFNNSLDDGLYYDSKGRSISYEEKIRLEKEKLLQQKIKLENESKAKAKRQVIPLKDLDID